MKIMLPACRAVLAIRVTFAALVLAVAGCTTNVAVAQSQTSKSSDGREAIMAILKAYADDWNRHDMNAEANLFHDDADWVNWRGGYWRGKAAIKKGFQRIHDTIYKASQLSPQRVEDLTFITPDIAIAHARSELTGDERAPGKIIPYRKTFLFTKQHGVWRIRAGHNTRLQEGEK